MRKKLRAIVEVIMFLSSIIVFMMLVFIDRMVNGILYNYGLQLNSQWTVPYQIYFDLGIALIIVNAIAVASLETTYPPERGEEPDINTSSGGKEALVSTPEVLPPLQVTEEKTEIKPQSSESAPLKKAPSIVHYCRYCGSENEADAIFCEKCGKNLVAKNQTFALTRLLFCRACGAKNSISAVYCRECGKLLN